MSNTENLMKRIRLGEDSALELKQILLSGNQVTNPKRDNFADELAAFANSRGGTIVLGVDDKTRDIIGIPLERLDAVESWVREICNDVVKPSLDVSIRKLELPDTTGALFPVISVEVPRSLYIHKSPSGYFRRIGGSKREMPTEVLTRLLQERSQSRVIRFDESPVPGTGFSHINMSLAKRFLRETNDPEVLSLRKLKILTNDEEGNERLTIGGTLLCCDAPETWLPHAMIQAVSYAGERTDVNYQNDARDIGGSLDSQVREALHFVRRNQQIRGTKQQERREQPQFSERAVFEAIVNAVAHRDYSIAGSRIQLHLFRNRMELYIPGGLANTLTPDSMALRQYSRNELIVSLLARCPSDDHNTLGRAFLMDRRGDGVPIILRESENLSSQKPEYTVIDDSELRLIIWAAGD